MILANKQLGETPLELLERIRREQPELVGGPDAKLSYAGRLDPMAEGQMIILVRDENSPANRAKFLGLDKEYVATFLIGVKTDTGDCLGLVEGETQDSAQHAISTTERVPRKSIAKQVEHLKQIKEQTYPWFSGKTVDGIKLFDHFKAGKRDGDIERPSRNVEIEEVELLNLGEQNSDEIKKYIFDAIGKVSGDFRQKKILERWTEFFAQSEKIAHKGFQKKFPAFQTFQTFQIRIVVSSGTFIRGLTENFDFPVVLFKLVRTDIKGL